MGILPMIHGHDARATAKEYVNIYLGRNNSSELKINFPIVASVSTCYGTTSGETCLTTYTITIKNDISVVLSIPSTLV